MSAGVALIALILDALLPYPGALQKRLGHPVQWIGKLIGFLETRLRRPDADMRAQRGAGILMLVILLLMTGVVAVLLRQIVHSLPFGWLWEALLASALLAQRQLAEMVRGVARALDRSVDQGSEAVSHIVGRDTSELDEAEISRAAIETLAENASDGVTAPLFWLILFGLPGIAVYKAINTADSMVGHLNDTYRHFGWASAKLDDWANFIPARLTALVFALAAYITPKADAGAAWQTARRDAGKHASPNAGWPEAAMAGALGFGLGGPRRYKGQLLDLPYMGDGKRDLTAADIRKALTLYVTGGLVLFTFTAMLEVFTL